jgi:diacylglycerol kinase (ATP)
MAQFMRRRSQNQKVNDFKSRGGVARIWRAFGYSRSGFISAFRHEAAFRQELAIGLPMIVSSWWLGRTAAEALVLSAVVVLVWIAELLNSAIEAVADAVSEEHHTLLGRAKDLGSAAVMLSLFLAGITWAVILLPRWLQG